MNKYLQQDTPTTKTLLFKNKLHTDDSRYEQTTLKLIGSLLCRGREREGGKKEKEKDQNQKPLTLQKQRSIQ